MLNHTAVLFNFYDSYEFLSKSTLGHCGKYQIDRIKNNHHSVDKIQQGYRGCGGLQQK